MANELERQVMSQAPRSKKPCLQSMTSQRRPQRSWLRGSVGVVGGHLGCINTSAGLSLNVMFLVIMQVVV